jgi:gamma-glutamylcyclotransferase (GGCT)/AIG2-like uncharacterized protein YtfP
VLDAHLDAHLDAKSGRRVYGTVLRLPESAEFLRELDVYEEFNAAAQELSQFVRVLQTVDLEAGGSLTCWIYVYNWPFGGARVVESGEYCRSRLSGQR